LPASLLGILIGTLLFGYMSTSVVRLIVGVVAVSFTLHFWISRHRSGNKDLAMFPQSYGIIGGIVAGFTSFVAHSGGPPINMYLLRRPLNRTDFAATTVVFFAVANYVKLIPYAWLGQFDTDNLATSAALVILAPIGVLIGAWMHARVTDRLFFAFVYVLLFIVGLKLVYDGLAGLL
jgi:hypothetical protein